MVTSFNYDACQEQWKAEDNVQGYSVKWDSELSNSLF